MDSDDPAVAALRRLIGDSVARRREVARKLGASEQSLYQIVTGVKLQSGKPRTVGRELREKLDRHYPGWLTAGLSETAATPARAAPPDLADALPVVLGAISALPPLRWEMVRSGLDAIVRNPEMLDDALPELQALLGPVEPIRKRLGRGYT